MTQMPPLKYRIFILIIFAVLLVLNTFTGWGLPITNTSHCLIDSTFTNTEDINSFLTRFKDKYIQNPILITITLLSDGLFIFSLIQWVNNSKTYRFIWTIVALYATKMFFGLLFRLRLPSGYLLSYPGVPSLTISYLTTNSFFFNGTIGLLTILAKEFYYTQKEFVMLMSIFDILVLGSSLIFLRGNYCIDLLFGVFFGDFIDELFRRGIFKKKKENNKNIK